VLHGGLFGEGGVLIDDLQRCIRKDYGFNADELEAEAQATGIVPAESPKGNARLNTQVRTRESI
jgi:hypothetical protein